MIIIVTLFFMYMCNHGKLCLFYYTKATTFCCFTSPRKKNHCSFGKLKEELRPPRAKKKEVKIPNYINLENGVFPEKEEDRKWQKISHEASYITSNNNTSFLSLVSAKT